MKPKVSIIVPCYNSEKWVEECVVSALTQNYENIEVIAVDTLDEVMEHALLRGASKNSLVERLSAVIDRLTPAETSPKGQPS